MKIQIHEKKWNMILLVGIIIFTILGMYLFWSIKLQGYSMPIQHKVNYSGEFTTSLGAVREIVIQHEQIETPVQICISVYDSNNEKCWEKTYENITITGKRQTLDSFEKEAPLELDKGTYYTEILVNGETDVNINCRFIEYSGSYKKLYSILCILLVVGEILVFFFNKKENLSLEKLYFVGTITIGVILNFAMPPLGVPDERAHMLKAYELSSQIMLQEKYDENGYLMIREEDYNSINYLHDISSITEWYDTFHVFSNKEGEKMVSAGVRSSVFTDGPYAYFPPAIGITVARILGLSGHMLLVLGRLCNLSFLAMLVALAIKIIPWGKFFFLVLGMFPEVLYVFTSYSYDGLNFALCMLIVAYFLKLYAQKDKISIKQVVLFCVLLLLMALIKMVYVVLGLLLLLLPIKKIDITKKQIIGSTMVGCIGIGVFAWLSLPRVLSVMGRNKAAVDYSNPNTRITLEYALQNREYSQLVFLNTIFGNSNTYFHNAMGEVIGIGRYDGLDCYTLPLWMAIAIVVLLLIGLVDTTFNTVPTWKRMAGGCIGIFTYLSVLLSMFFAFTTISDRRIMGIQGRYFLPIFALMPMIIKNKFYEIKHSPRTICFVGMGMINLIFIFIMFFHYVCSYFA